MTLDTSGDVPEGMDMPFGMSGASFGHIDVSQGSMRHGAGNMAGDVFPGGGPWLGVQMPDDMSGWSNTS